MTSLAMFNMDMIPGFLNKYVNTYDEDVERDAGEHAGLQVYSMYSRNHEAL